MSIFVDASAMTAMIAREPEARSFANRLGGEAVRLTSALAVWETARAVEKVRGVDFQEARDLVSAFLRHADLRLVTIGAEEAELSLDAHARYGRGNHPAKLNLGDCFAYACAARHGAVLLFKGDDFAQTDIADATLE